MPVQSDAQGLDGSPATYPVVLYSSIWRVVAAVLRFTSGAGLIVIVGSLTLFSAGPVNPISLLRNVVALCLLPRAAAWLLDRAFAAQASIEDDAVVFRQARGRVEIPLSSIAGILPWRIPLPGSGFVLQLRSTRRWHESVKLDDPIAFTRALDRAGAATGGGGNPDDPALAYAHARTRAGVNRPLRLLLKFPVFALVPTLPLFRVHQLIAYGGVFGEYYQYGLRAYLAGFGIYWATLTIYLMLYAALLRVPIEAGSAVAAIVTPSHALAARKIAERAGAVLYYAGVPVLLVLRFVPW